MRATPAKVKTTPPSAAHFFCSQSGLNPNAQRTPTERQLRRASAQRESVKRAQPGASRQPYQQATKAQRAQESESTAPREPPQPTKGTRATNKHTRAPSSLKDRENAPQQTTAATPTRKERATEHPASGKRPKAKTDPAPVVRHKPAPATSQAARNQTPRKTGAPKS